MKKFTQLRWVLLIVLSISDHADAQGTFLYDQQSADENTAGGGATTIQSFQPLGQSFAPSNSLLGFIRLYLGDRTINNTGATMRVDLHLNSIGGSILSSSDPVFMQDGFFGYTNFFFSTAVAVTPGTTYYFQPVVLSGDSWAIVSYNYNYPGGTAFFNGSANSAIDLWFREGIVVPEPSALSLIIGSGVLFYVRREKIGK